MLNQSKCYQLNGVDDLSAFKDTTGAMSTLGVSDAQQTELLRILSALLILGLSAAHLEIVIRHFARTIGRSALPISRFVRAIRHLAPDLESSCTYESVTSHACISHLTGRLVSLACAISHLERGIAVSRGCCHAGLSRPRAPRRWHRVR